VTDDILYTKPAVLGHTGVVPVIAPGVAGAGGFTVNVTILLTALHTPFALPETVLVN
jgi:hypothetical protein